MKRVEDLIRSSLLAFAMKSFAYLNQGKLLTRYPYVEYLARQFELVAQRERKRLLLSAPPRTMKTFMGSICCPAWILAHQPSAKILTVSYSQYLADKIAYAQREIIRSEFYQRVFPTRIAKNRSRLLDFATTAGGGVRSTSIEGGITGLGADYIFLDDPLQIKDWDNQKQLERVYRTFKGEIRSRLDNQREGCIAIIAHRLNENDLIGRLLEEETRWKHAKLPLFAPRARSYDLGGGNVWHRKKGEILRPDAYDAATIKELRSSMDPPFETIYQQNPGGRRRLRFRNEHFPLFSPSISQSETAVVLSIDPGQMGGPMNSYSVIQAWTYEKGTYKLIGGPRLGDLFDGIGLARC